MGKNVASGLFYLFAPVYIYIDQQLLCEINMLVYQNVNNIEPKMKKKKQQKNLFFNCFSLFSKKNPTRKFL
jgi:hypothetical protein